MTELIFMLTHHDVTIPNALEVFDEIKDTDLKFVGCKDIGLPIDEHKILFKSMRKEGITTFLEVVSHDEKKHFEGAKKAIQIGADYLIGGMPQFTKKTIDFLKEERVDIKFFPYVGEVVGHPCILEGSVEDIVENGIKFEKKGVDGINLLLYRYKGDTNLLLNRITSALHIPLIPAGNIDCFEKIDQMKDKHIWAFTIGGAILERKFAPGKSVKKQVETVLNRLR